MYVDRKLQIVNRAARPDLARAGRRVHYLHVPKCGGTTLRYVLEGFAATRGLTSANEARRTGDRSPDLVAAQVAMGHARPADGLSRSDTCYFTVLRDPVQRLRSLVAMMVRLRQLSPEAAVENVDWVQANWAVHLLTGATGPEGDPVSEAKRVLESRVHVFGFQERMAEFMALLSAVLEIDGIIYPAFQFTPEGRRLDERFDAAFVEKSSADRSLHAFAQDLYRDRFAAPAGAEVLNRRMPDRTYLHISVEPNRSDIEVSEVTFSG
jgi:hypothetical protein